MQQLFRALVLPAFVEILRIGLKRFEIFGLDLEILTQVAGVE